MKFRFLWIGKTKDKNWRALQEEYLHRLSHFIKWEIVEIKESQTAQNAQIESERILEKLNQKAFVVLLNITGRAISSDELAKEIEKWQMNALREVVFVIGGADGVSPEVANRADFRLSLSFLTFTHEMARVILLEQLYRAYSIIKGFPYQK